MRKQDANDLTHPTRIKGRGAGSYREGRFEALAKTIGDDSWYLEQVGAPRPPTRVSIETVLSNISRKGSHQANRSGSTCAIAAGH